MVNRANAVSWGRKPLGNVRPSHPRVLGSPERGAAGADPKARPPGAMLPRESAERRERGSGSCRGAILAHRNSGSVESTSIRRKAPLFAERCRKRVSAGLRKTDGSLQPLRRAIPATRVLESSDEEGRSHPCESLAHELSTRARATSVAQVRLFTLRSTSAAQRGGDRGLPLG